ncbi:MAG: TetR/AcrR family transcriptional regulator [Deltaproteobacteria bacterium]|nr:MAG: TetR/AcrR family transcriptional regulator [Deltaproteobacteria bacterium]
MTDGQVFGMAAQSRRQREREERRRDILDAAERVFLAKGFAQATMDEVAASCELSKGALYLYFRSKDELYVAVCLRTLAQLVGEYERVASSGKSGLDTLRDLGRCYVQFARDHAEQFRLGMSWMLSNARIDPDTRNYAEYRRCIQRLFAIAIETIERGQRDGSVATDVEPAQFAMQMWGATVGMLLLAANREELLRRIDRDVDFESLVPSFLDRVLDSLRPTRGPAT